MSGSLIVALAVAALGADYGWQPHPRGGLEYIIQIDPHMVDRLKQGIHITSDIPAEVTNIRSCRFMVGSDELPRIFELPVIPDPDVAPPPPVEPDPRELPKVPRDTPPEDVPGTLPNEGGSPDKVKKAEYLQDAKPTLPPDARQSNKIEPEKEPPSWLVATLAIGLMSTSAGMIFTGWTAWDYRGRYRKLLRKLPIEQRVNLGTTANDDSE